MAKAAWTLTVRQRSTDEDGTMHLVADLSDAGQQAAELHVAITAERVLTLLYDPVDDKQKLTGFYAWEAPR